MSEIQPPLSPKKPYEMDNAPLFVSIYVVLLGFFIMLNTISRRDEEKSEQVVKSVSAAFSIPSQYRPPVVPDKPTDMDPSILQMFQEIEQALASLIIREGVEAVQVGNRMKITIAKADLYLDDSIKLRKENEDFAERISKLLLRWGKGYSIETRYLVGVEKKDTPELRSTDIRRSGGFVRLLTEKGVDSASLIAGLDESHADRVTLEFNVLGTIEGQSKFVPPAAAAEEEGNHGK